MNQKLLILLVGISLVFSSASLLLSLKSSDYSLQALQSDASGFDCEGTASRITELHVIHRAALAAGQDKRAERLATEIGRLDQLLVDNDCDALLLD